MYINIDDIKGKKRIDLSYPIHPRKEIAVITMFSENIQYEIAKTHAIMDPISDTKQLIPSRTYAGRELTLRITDQNGNIITDGPQITIVLHICDHKI